MKYFLLSVILLGFLCSCAHDPEPKPLYTSRFYTEKDAVAPNGWRFREDGFFARPLTFEVKPYLGLDESSDEYDERANLFTIKTGEKPAIYYYTGFYPVEDGRAAVQLIFADEEKIDGVNVSVVELTTGKKAKLVLNE